MLFREKREVVRFKFFRVPGLLLLRSLIGLCFLDLFRSFVHEGLWLLDAGFG
jgi:hypothetical protein